MLTRQCRRHRPELRLRSSERDAIAEPSDHANRAIPPVRTLLCIGRERHEDVRVLEQCEAEGTRQDADDDVRHAVDSYRHTERATAGCRAHEALADYGDIGA